MGRFADYRRAAARRWSLHFGRESKGFVVPPLDVSRTKALIRLLCKQIRRRLMESPDSPDGIAPVTGCFCCSTNFPRAAGLTSPNELAFMVGYVVLYDRRS